MFAILIDPVSFTIERIPFDASQPAAASDALVHAALGGATEHRVCPLPGTPDAILTNPHDDGAHGGFRLYGDPHKALQWRDFAGRALVLALHDPDAPFAAPETSLGWLYQRLSFLPSTAFKPRRLDSFAFRPGNLTRQLTGEEAESEEDRFYRALLGPSS